MSQRCVVCGEAPADGCCDRCHHVHNKLNRPLIDAVDVRVARHITGDSLTEFAKRVGMSPSAVYGWLYRGKHPTARPANIIADILEASV